MQRANLIGQRFGRYTVISYCETRATRGYWNVKCDCGELREASSGNLKSGAVRSCGCLMRENASKANTTHGATRGRSTSREYRAWQDMKTRCYNPNRDNGDRYFERGIKVSDEWKNSFETFFKDMGKCPDGMQIDRINNDLGYSKGNCRWTTIETQQNNKRSTSFIEYSGERKSRSAWAKDPRCKVSYWGLRTRLDRGWKIEDAIMIPKLKGGNEHTSRS